MLEGSNGDHKVSECKKSKKNMLLTDHLITKGFVNKSTFKQPSL